MRFWVDVADGEHEVVQAARLAGHRRVHDAAVAEFFVVESDRLVDSDGELVDTGVPGDVIGGRVPRLEFQLLSDPGRRDGIGEFTSAIQVVASSGRVISMGYGHGLEAILDSLPDFLLHVGEQSDADTVGSDDRTIPAAVEEFLTLWTLAVTDLPLDRDTQRVADALTVMVGEVVKTVDPPRGVLREALSWFAAKIDRFADEFAGAAGKTFGVTAAVGASAVVTGRLPQLAATLDKALGLLE